MKNLRVTIAHGRTESTFCTEPDREFLHELLDEYLDAREKGECYKADDTHQPHEFWLVPCSTHDESQWDVIQINVDPDEAAVIVPSGTDLPNGETPSGLPIGAQVVSKELKSLEEGDVVVAHLEQTDPQYGSSDYIPSAERLRRWAERHF